MGVVVLFLVFAAVYARSGPPAAKPATAPSDQFSAGREYDELARLVGDGVPHPIGSDANARVRARIVARFTELGYQPAVQTAFACNDVSRACGTVQNVIAIRPGRDAGKAVMLAAHYDSVAAGPGASDDAAGVAAVLEVARVVIAEPQPRNPIVFLIDDGEEAGLLGAWGFVRDHPLAGRIGAVINLEARGTSGASVMFETSAGNRWLIDLLARSVARPIASSLFYPIYERLPNDTDLTVFKLAGLPGVNFAFIGDVPRYHTPLDSVDHADRGSLQHHGDNALAMVRALGNADLESPSGGDVVFFDVLAFGIVRWPVGATAILAWIALGLVLVAAAVMVRRRSAGIWRGLLALVAWLVMVGAAGGGTWGLLAWMTNRGTWPGGATTAPRGSLLAFWLAGLALVTLVAALAGRWTRPGGAWIGCWVGWSIAGVVAAVYVPEAAYLFIVPALVAGSTGLTLSYGGRTFRSANHAAATPRDAPVVASLLPLAVAAMLIMPSAWVLFDAIGPPALPIAGTALGLIATTLAPSIAATGASRWTLPVAFAAGSVVLLALAGSAAPFSIDRPERMNITFLQQNDNAQARWIVAPQSGVLPDAMRGAAPFGGTREQAPPWSTGLGFIAPAAAVPLDGPALQILEQHDGTGDRSLRLRARSPRGAPVLTLVLPPDRIASVSLNGFEFPQSAAVPGAVGRAYTCYAVPAEGIEFAIRVNGESLVDGYLIDRSSGLPEAGQTLMRARPREAVPSSTGDVTIVYARVRF
jgi:hypothetical protein